ncbi:hypothetical protein V8J88_00020 [Massilia sp. W12]|uniref:hypothetical protein n=1 Tax=Massilia sp. W12 TaxID=3126507 RepID=UPI0030D0CBD0
MFFHANSSAFEANYSERAKEMHSTPSIPAPIIATPFEYNDLLLMAEDQVTSENRLDAYLLAKDKKSGKRLWSILISKGSKNPMISIETPALIEKIEADQKNGLILVSINSGFIYSVNISNQSVTLLNPPAPDKQGPEYQLVSDEIQKNITAHLDSIKLEHNGIIYRQATLHDGDAFSHGGTWLLALDSQSKKLLWSAQIAQWAKNEIFFCEKNLKNAFRKMKFNQEMQVIKISSYNEFTYEVNIASHQVKTISSFDSLMPELGPPPILP